VEDFTTIATLDLKKSYHHSGPSPMRLNDLWARPDDRVLPGHKSLVVNMVVIGLFEEEEEGTGITSNIVKVNGEDLDTPGYPRGDRVRREVRDLGSWVRPPWLALHETL